MSEISEIYDISPLISSDLAVFPGDTAFSRTVAMAFAKGDHLALSSINTTVHLGSHADAPSHYHVEGQTIEGVGLERYVGKCQVISVATGNGGRIGVEALANIHVSAKRVLLKTRSFLNPNVWRGDFSGLTPELVTHLHDHGVQLVGVDTPSVDRADDKTLAAHQQFFRTKMLILEGLVLDAVPDGIYTLIALPLKIQGADGSPVRAVLLPSQTDLATW